VRREAAPTPRERPRDPDDVDIINPVHGDVLARKPAPVESDAAREARQKEAAERRARPRRRQGRGRRRARARAGPEREAKRQEHGERAGALAKSVWPR
jgi:hypothetical protein